jgi:hypothetical protein
VSGGSLIVETSSRKRGRILEYICSRHRTNGSCTNALRMPVAGMNEGVLQAIEEHALTPEAIESVVTLSERDDAQQQQAALAKERQDIGKRIGRLVAAIEGGADARSISAKLRELEARGAAIDAQVAGLRPVPRLPRPVIVNRLEAWRRNLRQSLTSGRTVLQKILRGRIVFTPRRDFISGDIDGYEYAAETRFDQLFEGIVVERPANLPYDRTGLEDVEVDALPYDAEYGKLLDRVKVGTSPRATDGTCIPIDRWFAPTRRRAA